MIKLNKYPIETYKQPTVSETLLNDIDLNEFLTSYYENPKKYLTTDIRAICERNEILNELMQNKQLTQAFGELYGNLKLLKEMAFNHDSDPKHILSSIMAFKELYLDIKQVCKAIKSSSGTNKKFVEIGKQLEKLLNEKYPCKFLNYWEEFANSIDLPRSLKYRIYFNDNFHISSISLVGAYSHVYKRPALLRTNSNIKTKITDNQLSLTPSAPSDESKLIDPDPEISKLMYLSRNINKVFIEQMLSAQKIIKSKISIIFKYLNSLYEELNFYINSIKLIESMNDIQFSMHFADVERMEMKSFYTCQIYHPCLALKAKSDLVFNNVDMSENKGILLLGGINRGGKTTFLKTCCCIQVLFQMGLPVPAAQATLSPCSGILCAFSRNETEVSNHGKLGQELTLIHDTLKHIDEFGFFVFNEPISATSPHESYLLSKKVICILKEIGARGIWVTHLYQLFDDVDGINRHLDGSIIACANASDSTDKYKISPGVPAYNSEARKVFANYTS